MKSLPQEPPLYLITNDDGIDSPFLRAWAQIMSTVGRVVVVAPASGQSGVGRALTVRGTLTAQEHKNFPFPAWSIEGTPTDCVNIALAHFLKERPTAVLSGINEGFNTGVPLIWSSGTLAAAFEGAFWGIPSWAASFQLSWEVHRALLMGQERAAVLEPLLPAVHHAAHHMLKLIQETPEPLGQEPRVHNLNFPSDTTPQTPIWETEPAVRNQLTFFQKAREPNMFKFSRLTLGPACKGTDADALAQGAISHSRLASYMAQAPSCSRFLKNA